MKKALTYIFLAVLAVAALLIKRCNTRGAEDHKKSSASMIILRAPVPDINIDKRFLVI